MPYLCLRSNTVVSADITTSKRNFPFFLTNCKPFVKVNFKQIWLQKIQIMSPLYYFAKFSSAKYSMNFQFDVRRGNCSEPELKINKQRILHGRAEIRIFSSSVENISRVSAANEFMFRLLRFLENQPTLTNHLLFSFEYCYFLVLL